MFDTISMYLETHATPEQKQVCMAGCQSLADAGVTDHVDILSDEIAAIDSQSPITDDLMLSIIHSVLIPMHRNALGEFGIVLSADVTLLVITDILNGIRALGNYGDPATLNSLCDAPEGPEAALADMLELVGAFTAAEYLPVLETVNPQLLDRIEQRDVQVEHFLTARRDAQGLAQLRADDAGEVAIQLAEGRVVRGVHQATVEHQVASDVAVEIAVIMIAADAERLA